MGTKKIREALLSHGMTHRVNGAWLELEAIEQAARVIVREKALEDWTTSQPVELADGIRVIQAIAMEDVT